MLRPVSFLAALLVFGAIASPGVQSPAHAETLVVQTDMYGSQQVPPVNTVAYGFVRFFFDESRTNVTYTVDVKGLSTSLVTGADIHRGAPGVRGPVVKHLADGGFIVTSGSMQLTQAELEEMASGNWYVSLTSTTHPNGELRGQIALPAGFFGAPVSQAAPVAQEPAASVAAAPAPAAVEAAAAAPPAAEAAAAAPAPAQAAVAAAPAPAAAAPATSASTTAAAPPSAQPASSASPSRISPPRTGDGGLQDSGAAR